MGVAGVSAVSADFFQPLGPVTQIACVISVVAVLVLATIGIGRRRLAWRPGALFAFFGFAAVSSGFALFLQASQPSAKHLGVIAANSAAARSLQQDVLKLDPEEQALLALRTQLRHPSATIRVAAARSALAVPDRATRIANSREILLTNDAALSQVVLEEALNRATRGATLSLRLRPGTCGTLGDYLLGSTVNFDVFEQASGALQGRLVVNGREQPLVGSVSDGVVTLTTGYDGQDGFPVRALAIEFDQLEDSTLVGWLNANWGVRCVALLSLP